MVSKKRVVIFAAVITGILGVVSLLRVVEKEDFNLRREQAAIAIQAGKEEAPELAKAKLKPKEKDVVVDAGVDLAPMIAELIDVAQRLQKLEKIIVKGEFESEDVAVITDSSLEERKEIFSAPGNLIEKVDEQASGLLEMFYGALKNKKKAGINYAKGQAQEELKYHTKIKTGFENAVNALNDAQKEITGIRISLGKYPQTNKVKEAERKMDNLEAGIASKIENYNFMIDKWGEIVVIWGNTIDEMDAIEGKN